MGDTEINQTRIVRIMEAYEFEVSLDWRTSDGRRGVT